MEDLKQPSPTQTNLLPHTNINTVDDLNQPSPMQTDLPTHTNINTMEDFNEPSPERINLLKRLDEVFGPVAPQFWAACQICDLNKLQSLLSLPESAAEGFGIIFNKSVRYCKLISYISLL
jgi:hypothetical protein